MEGQTGQKIIFQGCMDGAAEALGHDYEEKGGEGVALSDSSRGEKGFEGTPLIRREKKAEEVRLMIQVTQF
jgi:hypothetical protein